MKYIVFTEIIDRVNHSVERWYYGTYSNRDRANEIAIELGSNFDDGIWHCVCDADEAEGFGIKNMP